MLISSQALDLGKLTSGFVFPFFDQLSQNADLPSIIYYIAIVWFMLQSLTLVLWLPGNDSLLLYPPMADVARAVHLLTTFSTESVTQDSILITFIISSVVFAITAAMLIGLWVFFWQRHRFIIGFLYPARLLVEVVPILLTFPAGGVAGWSLFFALHAGGIQDVAIFIIVLLELIFFLAIFSAAHGFLGASPHLQRTPFACFNTSEFRGHVMSNSICFIIQTFSCQFDVWFIFFIIAVHGILSAIWAYEYTWRPFVYQWMNNLMMGIAIYCALMDVLCISIHAAHVMSSIPIFACMFGFVPVAGGIVFAIQRLGRRRALAALSLVRDDEAAMSDEQLFSEFGVMRIEHSERLALFYLNFAVSIAHMRYFDFCFMKYIIKWHRTSTALTHCARLMSWLPHATRSLYFLCSEALERRDLRYVDRFVLFQLGRIRLCRESSTSNSASEKLSRVKSASIQTCRLMRAFWDRSDCNIGLLNSFAHSLASTNSSWAEAIEDFPNSVQFRDVYICYLVEAATRYSEAIFHKSRTELIENGANLRVDDCFRRFVRTFPDYLKGGVLDTKGNRVKQSNSKLNSGSVQSASGDPGSELDAALEDGIGMSIINQARVRLTVERAFTGRRPHTFPAIILGSAFMFFVCLGIFIYVFVSFQNYFDVRNDVATRMVYQNNARASFDAGLISWLYYWGTNKGVIDYEGPVGPIIATEDMTGAFFPADVQRWDLRAEYFNRAARSTYDLLIESVVEMAMEGIDLDTYAVNFFSPTAMPVTFCTEDGNRSKQAHRGNVRTVWTYYFLMESIFGSVPLDKWFVSGEPQCVTISSMPSLLEPFTEVRKTLALLTETLFAEAVDLFNLIRIWLPLGMFVFCIVLWCVVSFFYIREVNHFTSLLLTLPKHVKRECLKPIRHDKTLDDGQVSQAMLAVSGYSLPIVFNAVIVIVIAGAAATLLGQCWNLVHTNDLYSYLNGWIVNSRSRKCLVLEGTLGMIFGIIMHNNLTKNPKGANFTYLVWDDAKMMMTLQLSKLQARNKGFQEEVDGVPSAVGWSEPIDRLSFESQCEGGGETYHDQYRCSSAMHLMRFYENTIALVAMGPEVYGGHLNAGPTGEMIHLIDRHLIPILLEIDDLYSVLTDEFRSTFISQHKLFFAFEIVLIVFIAGLISAYLHTINNCYDVLLALLRRVSPVYILSSEPLECYLLNRSSAKRRDGMTADERIIDHSTDCIVCTGPTGLIDMINPAVSKVFGYSPEQLLGQSLQSLMLLTQTENIDQQIRLMADHQSAPLYEGHVTCLTDNDNEIPCSISLLALFTDDEISSFVAILKDESELLRQQVEAETAKKKSETLLYQILPRDIVARLNAGEKDISFSIPSATIMFIDIVRFSEYAANLTPQDIMGNLSVIFAGFDEACAAYPLLIKIKLIGDVYMAAGGLFSPDVPPASHAEQMIKFAIDALDVIDESNLKLNAALAIRIGINSGGPILAGVLGTDKPTFDIIGDPINVAARLQSTDVPGKIQISETTQRLVQALDFPIEYRGEIELKGKGKRKTYLIDPATPPLQTQALATMSQSTLEDFARFLPSPR